MLNTIINFFKNKEDKKESCLEKVLNELKEKERKIKKEYNDFFYSTDNLIGQPISVIKEKNDIKPVLEKRSINIPSKGICPTCGGKVIGGKCQYCGNQYDDNTEIIELIYECEYGKKTYIFKNGLLETINTEAISIENFL